MSLHQWVRTLEWCRETDGQRLRPSSAPKLLCKNIWDSKNTHEYEPEHSMAQCSADINLKFASSPRIQQEVPGTNGQFCWDELFRKHLDLNNLRDQLKWIVRSIIEAPLPIVKWLIFCLNSDQH